MDRKAARGRITGVKSDEYCFDGRPSLIGVTCVQNRASVVAVGHTVVIPFYCSA